MSQPPLYLDYNATTPIAPSVLEVLQESLAEIYGNASSAHDVGRAAQHRLELARGQVADLLGVPPHTIVFTSGGTESDNLALLGAVSDKKPRRKHIVTTNIEHPAIEETCRHLEAKGFSVTRIPVQEDGCVRSRDVLDAIRDDTFLVTVMLANNETGAIQPLGEIGRGCRERDTWLHTDAAQAVGKIPTRADELSVDMLTIAGHKLYAPKGIGALYVRDGVTLHPIQFGGGHEKGLRPGTENVPLISALGEACRLAKDEMNQRVAHCRHLCDRLLAKLKESLGHIDLNGPEEMRLPNTLNVSIEGIRAHDVLARLESVATSAGSACHAGETKPSAVLLAMGLSPERALSALRLSVGRDTSDDDVDRAADAIIRAVQAIRHTAAS